MDNVRQRVQNGTWYNTPWSPDTEPPDLHSLIQNNTTTPGYPVAGRQSHNFEAPNHHRSHRVYNSSRHVTNYNTSSTPVYPVTIRSPPCPSSSSNYQSHHSRNSSTLPSAYLARHYLWTREKCSHSVLWDKVDIEGCESCEKCHRNRKFILQCPQCGIKACGSCQADLRPKGWKVSVMRQVAKQSHQNHIDTLIMRDRDF